MKLKFVFLALLLSGCASASADYAVKDGPKDRALPITSILYANKNVAAGSEIMQSDLKVHWIDINKKPTDALETVFQAVGLKAKFDLAEGQIVSTHDVADYSTAGENTTVLALRLDNEVVQKLQREAQQKNITLSHLCSGALDEYIANKAAIKKRN
ncbi:MAG: flagella basal body P-ring formation protein FlgA [Cyanobacteria bacterium TGS_CYA1]|nr:flagella basal body P-ring formation protein FlgA [Cyanobacteria bacterium TGS_CYA1]